jgi:hypothetical protein
LIDKVGRLPKESRMSRMSARSLKPELKLPKGGGNEGFVATLNDE